MRYPFIFRRKKDIPPAKVDYLVVGLGNPGRKYEQTRHNAGFLAVDLLAERYGVRLSHLKCKAVTGHCAMGGAQVVLAKPQTFMNLSGEAVRDLAAAFDVPPQRIIVIFDDAALLPGRVRVRRSGSHGGHNGIKNIIYHLNTETFPRIKIGIGGPDRTREDMVDFVLDTIDSDAWAGIRQAPDIALCIIEKGVEAAMQAFNGSAAEGKAAAAEAKAAAQTDERP